jgi:membrane protease YdiL (CAAX protease family)
MPDPGTITSRGAGMATLLAYFVFAVVSAIGLVAYRLSPHSPVTLWTTSLVPYPLILAALVYLRRFLRLRVPVGSLMDALKKGWLLWTILSVACAAAMIASGELHGHSALHFVQRIVTFSVLDPCAEEFCFRGVIQTSLESTHIGARRVLGVRGSIWLGAILFGMAHFLNLIAGQPPGIVVTTATTAFLAGLAFGFIYGRTSNLWYAILLHGFSNLLMG